MPSSTPVNSPAPGISMGVCAVRPRAVWLTAALLVLLTVLAYSNSFRVPFIFDDDTSIRDNASIRHLSTALFPDLKSGETASGRPVLNATLALSYQLSGLEPWGYHATNLAIHIAAGLVLLGLVRRTLLTLPPASVYAQNALLISAATAALWMLHPLATESVTYVIQRAESLAALFYLLTLYCLVRSVEQSANMYNMGRGGRRLWLVLSIVACWLGMASKEIMVSAPLIALLYDRSFLSAPTTFRAVITRRKGYYIALFTSWLLLAMLVISTGTRGGTAGLSGQISSWHYALTQCQAIITYLKLSFVPAPLILDYGTATIASLSHVWAQAFVVLALLGVTAWAVVRKPAVAFPGAVFFAVLAPTSSFLPITSQTIAEHRMYLPLAAIIVGTILLVGKLPGIFRDSGRIFAGVSASLAVALGVLTYARNNDYHTIASIWSDTVDKNPNSYRAHNNLGAALTNTENYAEAEYHCRESLRLNPGNSETLNNLGFALNLQHRYSEALPCFDEALQLMYRSGDAAVIHVLANKATALAALGRTDEALSVLSNALSICPKDTATLVSAGDILLGCARFAEARGAYQKAVAVDGANAAALCGLGNTFIALGESPESAERCFRAVIASNPSHYSARQNLGQLLLNTNRPAEAALVFAQIILSNPGDAGAWLNHGQAAYKSGNYNGALVSFNNAAANAPSSADAYYRIGNTLLKLDRPDEAVRSYYTAIRLNPNFAEPHNNIATIFASTGRLKEAIAEFQKALAIAPDYAAAQINLTSALAQFSPRSASNP